MNEELLNELSEAMKRRDKANAAIARWTEQRDDAEDDIQELSARITDYYRVDNVTAESEPEQEQEPVQWTSLGNEVQE